MYTEVVKAVLALLVVLGLSSCVLAGGYGRGAQFQTYAAYRPAVYQQVGYGQTYARPYTGKAVGISGGGGIILLAVFAPVLVASLVSSNDALWDSIDKK
uniref:Lipoprotein n=1 Tax=Magallana gigas TaxID=29159 RepID=K1QM50_MAGGI